MCLYRSMELEPQVIKGKNQRFKDFPCAGQVVPLTHELQLSGQRHGFLGPEISHRSHEAVSRTRDLLPVATRERCRQLRAQPRFRYQEELGHSP